MRGAEGGSNVDRIALEDARPDHLNYRCIVGFYYLKTGSSQPTPARPCRGKAT